MKKFEIKSVFEQISTEVFKMSNVNEAKTFINEFITNKGINGIDKQVITNNVSKCTNISAIQHYICNSLLKYEGMSLN
jgi:hypothetical protein